MQNRPYRDHRRRNRRDPSKPKTIREERREFQRHLATYLIMGVFFLAVNIFTFRGMFWFFWPMLGWGIGLAFHFLKAYVPAFYEEDQLEEELDLRNVDYEPHEELEEMELPQPDKKWREQDLV